MPARRFTLPFDWAASGHVATVEQDTLDDIANCVEVVLRTHPGDRLEVPAFGSPDLLFEEKPVTLSDIAEAVEHWEPRANALIEEDPETVRNAAETILNVTVRGVDG